MNAFPPQAPTQQLHSSELAGIRDTLTHLNVTVGVIHERISEGPSNTDLLHLIAAQSERLEQQNATIQALGEGLAALMKACNFEG